MRTGPDDVGFHTVGFHAVVLAGGRSSRLDGHPKAGLRQNGRTLVDITVTAVRNAAGVAVVGPPELVLPDGVLHTREEPAFSGPAAGMAAGLRALEVLPPEAWTMTLACDMPGVARAVSLLLASAVEVPDAVGHVCTTPDGRHQHLAALYRTDVLRAVFAGGDAANRSVRSFIGDLPLVEVAVPEESTADVDTWEDVRRFELN